MGHAVTITSSVARRTALLLLLVGIGCSSRAPNSASSDESVRAALEYLLLPDKAAKIMGLSGPLARPVSVISEKAEL